MVTGRLFNVQPGTYHLFRIGDQDWIVLALEIGPLDEVVAWANKVLEQHADRLAIVATQDRLGPIAGTYDELRIYNYPLGPTAVRRSFEAGPGEVDVAETDEK